MAEVGRLPGLVEEVLHLRARLVLGGRYDYLRLHAELGWRVRELLAGVLEVAPGSFEDRYGPARLCGEGE